MDYSFYSLIMTITLLAAVVCYEAMLEQFVRNKKASADDAKKIRHISKACFISICATSSAILYFSYSYFMRDNLHGFEYYMNSLFVIFAILALPYGLSIFDADPYIDKAHRRARAKL